MRVRIRSNAAQVAERLEERGRKAEGRVKQELEQAGPELVKAVKGVTPTRSGRLRSSWAIAPGSRGVIVRNTTRYAGFVRGGSLIPDASRALREQVRARKARIAQRIKEG